MGNIGVITWFLLLQVTLEHLRTYGLPDTNLPRQESNMGSFVWETHVNPASWSLPALSIFYTSFRQELFPIEWEEVYGNPTFYLPSTKGPKAIWKTKPANFQSCEITREMLGTWWSRFQIARGCLWLLLSKIHTVQCHQRMWQHCWVYHMDRYPNLYHI